MITVVCWVWTGARVYRPEYVNRLADMLQRYLPEPHRLVCITDEPSRLFDCRVEVLPTPEAAREAGELQTPENHPGMPSCYRKLWLFSKEARAIGERFLSIDVDVVITGSLSKLVASPAPFIGWRPKMAWGNPNRIAGGLYMMDAGVHPEVWEDFSPDGIKEAAAAGFRGSDQAWISYKIGSKVALWPGGTPHGVYALSDLRGQPLPADSSIVQFCGHLKPWDDQAMKSIPWMRSHYNYSNLPIAPEVPKEKVRMEIVDVVALAHFEDSRVGGVSRKQRLRVALPIAEQLQSLNLVKILTPFNPPRNVQPVSGDAGMAAPSSSLPLAPVLAPRIASLSRPLVGPPPAPGSSSSTTPTSKSLPPTHSMPATENGGTSKTPSRRTSSGSDGRKTPKLRSGSA